MWWLGLWMLAAAATLAGGAGDAGDQPLRVVINIPAYRLEVFAGDSLVQRSAIAVGMRRYDTPRGTFAISRVEWNPRWVPPESDWAAKERPQGPGPANPMGQVKLYFRPMYFVHGTPAEHSMGSASSHGCVRMRNADAVALARLVHRYGSRAVGDSDVARWLADRKHTYTIVLDDSIPLELRYDLVELRDARVFVYPDVYRLATRSLRDEVYVALEAARVDTTRLDRARVRVLVRRVPRAGRSVPLAALLVREIATASSGVRRLTPPVASLHSTMMSSNNRSAVCTG